MIRLSKDQIEAIGSHGSQEFPHECVGVILGDVAKTAEGDIKIVRELRPLANTFEASAEFEAAERQAVPGEEAPVYGRERRYLISPDEMFALMQEERRTKRRVLGFYHSHPNHPARPSDTDLKASHAWYTYLIISILDGRPDALTAWRLNDDQDSFVQEDIEQIS